MVKKEVKKHCFPPNHCFSRLYVVYSVIFHTEKTLNPMIQRVLNTEKTPFFHFLLSVGFAQSPRVTPFRCFSVCVEKRETRGETRKHVFPGDEFFVFCTRCTLAGTAFSGCNNALSAGARAKHQWLKLPFFRVLGSLYPRF